MTVVIIFVLRIVVRIIVIVRLRSQWRRVLLPPIPGVASFAVESDRSHVPRITPFDRVGSVQRVGPLNELRIGLLDGM